VTAGGIQPRGWKVAVALLSLALSLLLWLNGLIDSLGRPSVGNDLNRRQLELAVLASPQLPGPLRAPLAGTDPLAALDEALGSQITDTEEAGQPAAADLLLERSLLLQRQGKRLQANALLGELRQREGTPEQRVAVALESGQPKPASEARQLAGSLRQGPLLQQWSCLELGGDAQTCQVEATGRRAAGQLLAVTLGPLLVMLLGVALLLRELWLRWRGRATALPPLVGPALTGVDVVLLIATGFVVIGELLTPLLIAPLLSGLLTAWQVGSPLREGLSVLGLYLALMAAPLLFLALMLRGLGPGPEGGWLQFRWQPLGLNLRRALKVFLIALPLVSLVGWMQAQIWGDPGGSNPLLELVLKSHNLPALACFGFTAVVLAPLFEETIFRGVLLPVAGRELGNGWGVLISAAVFGVAHLSLGELPPLFVLGLGLGWLRLSSGRLGACVLMHALWNGLTFTNLVVLGS